MKFAIIAAWLLRFAEINIFLFYLFIYMGISLKERQITEEPMKVKIWKK
jgi:hypothetical protein